MTDGARIRRNVTRLLVAALALAVVAVIVVTFGKGRSLPFVPPASLARGLRLGQKGSDVTKTSRPLPNVTADNLGETQLARGGPLNDTGAVDVAPFLHNPGRNEPEHGHVFFLKVHKAASTTLQTMLLRFAFVRNLSLMLPRDGSAITQHRPSIDNPLLNSSGPDPHRYDILCSHVIYSPQLLSRYLHSDTVNIAIVRDPFQQFVSAFKYYSNLPYLRAVGSSNPIGKFLRERTKYELPPLRSFTNERQTADFGYDPKLWGNMTRFYEYLLELDRVFHLVMVVELFDQSLILLRRLLHWQWKDILFLPMNQGGFDIPYQATEEDKQLFRKWTTHDYPLYYHFRFKLECILSRMPKEFFQEVVAFRKCREQVEGQCSGVRGRGSRVITSCPVSRWSGGFNVTEEDCFLLKQPEKAMTSLAREKQKKRLDLQRQEQAISSHRQG